MVLQNGVFVGLVQKTTEAKGLSSASFYLLLTPHGIFELTAIFIAAGLGIRFGLIVYRSLWRNFKNQNDGGLFMSFVTEMKYYTVLIVILLSVAAIIEVTISPLLIAK